MAEQNTITCPHCGEVFPIDETGYTMLLAQVRDAAFEREVQERERLLMQAQKQAIVAAEERTKQDYIQQLAQAQAKVAQVEDQLAAQQQTSQLELERAQAQQKADIAEYATKLAEQEKLREELLRLKDDEIERLRDMKARQSTKMLGESLEQHCLTEFNKVRAMAFPRAEFGKDNDIVEGTKGDFVFRESSNDGIEFLSIMFEMKNEEDTTATKHKNADFFAKLDKDRIKKGCEYAILVSLLEADSDYYNQGIVEVTDYPKMYVIRPQFFVPMIGLLRNMALASLADRQQLAQLRNRDIDVTKFEDKLAAFRDGFGKNMDLASRKFEAAIADIDKSIAALQKVREELLSSQRALGHANTKVEGLTVKRLTHGNPTMRQKFEDARQDSSAEGD